jgi:hypothetical protein
MAPRKPIGKKEGGLSVDSDRTEFEGPVAGRDNVTTNTGVSGAEVKGIIETLLKHFPQRILDNPGELDKTLGDFRLFHEQLHEYKELHNAINEILVAFEPFKAEIDRSNSRRSIPKPGLLRDLWRPVSMSVVALLNWSQKIHRIGKPFQIFDDKSRSGEDWAIQFSGLQSRINEHLGMVDPTGGGGTSREVVYPSQMQILAYQRLGTEVPWWETLLELTSEFQHTSSHHMNSADKQLRQTAQELFNLSNKALSNY